jgi:hypothetical protein
MKHQFLFACLVVGFLAGCSRKTAELQATAAKADSKKGESELKALSAAFPIRGHSEISLSHISQTYSFSSQEPLSFSYLLLAHDTLPCQYLKIENIKAQSRTEIKDDQGNRIVMRKYLVDTSLNISYLKYNFSGTAGITKLRDAIEFDGKIFKIDSLLSGKNYINQLQMLTGLINVAKFSFNKSNYIAFFVQDYSNPVTEPNTDLLLFEITNLKQIKYIPIPFQASEDLKCINDFNEDGVLDIAIWSFGYNFVDSLVRFELVGDSKFVLTKKDHVKIEARDRGYFVNVGKSSWPYGSVAP